MSARSFWVVVQRERSASGRREVDRAFFLDEHDALGWVASMQPREQHDMRVERRADGVT
jgi:hypothetical protein